MFLDTKAGLLAFPIFAAFSSLAGQWHERKEHLLHGRSGITVAGTAPDYPSSIGITGIPFSSFL